MNDSTPYSELLSSFLDNELDGVETSTLFYSLAQNQDLQTELRHLIAVRSALHGSLLSPPDYLTARVLAATGLAAAPGAPPGAASGAAPAVAEASGSTLTRVLSGRPFLMAISSLVTAAVMWFVWPGVRQEARVTSPDSLRAPAARSEQAAQRAPVADRVSPSDAGAGGGGQAGRADIRAHAPAPAIVATATDVRSRTSASVRAKPRNTFGDAARNARESTRQPVLNADAPANAAGGGERVVPAIEAVPKIEAVPMRNSAAPRALPVEEVGTAGGEALPLAPAELDVADVPRFRFALRGFGSRSFPNPDIAANLEPPFNNLAISMVYAPNAHHAFGVEAGQENVLQVYRRRDGDTVFTTEQNYLAAWGGGVYQYSMNEIAALGGVQPFGGVMAGAMATGPMARATLGLRLRQGNAALMVGGEGTIVGYRFQDEWFSTSMLGFTYGLSIEF